MEKIPDEAQRLHNEARDAGGRGDYDTARRLLNQAHVLAPSWAHPVYDAAFTYLLQDDTAKAEELYEIVDEMEPRGFFTCKASLDILRREREGRLPPGFSKAFALLEWIDPEKKRRVLRDIVERHPDFAQGWWALSSLLEDPEERLQALDNGLAGHPDQGTLGMLLLNKAMLLRQLGRPDEGAAILRAVAEDPETTLGNQAWAEVIQADWPA